MGRLTLRVERVKIRMARRQGVQIFRVVNTVGHRVQYQRAEYYCSG